MHVIVTLKQVPDPNIPPSLLRIDEAGQKVVTPSGLTPVMNGYDANALEAALRLQQKHGAKVTVVSLGDATVINSLRKALAMGAQAAVHVAGPSGLECDSFATASVLAAAIRRLAPIDLVLTGRQASDSDAGQVPCALAELLDLPAVTPVREIAEVGNGEVLLERLAEEGIQRLKLRLPALLAMSSEANQPRHPSLKGFMLAKKADIPTWTIEGLGIAGIAAGVTLRRLYIEPPPAPQLELVSGGSPAEIGRRLADKLHDIGAI